MRYIQSFSTSGTEQTALDERALGKPYVCFIEDGRYIDWNGLSPTPPAPETRMVATYNVTSTTKNVKIINNTSSRSLSAELEDGTAVEMPESTGFKYYMFPATGQQKVFYTFLTTPPSMPSFDGCGAMVDIYLPEGIVNMRMMVFRDCSGLTSMTIPDSVSAITGGSNFAGCSRLRSVEIGAGIKALGDQVFHGCSVLSSVTINAAVPPSIGTGCLTGANNAYFYVPDAAVDTYKAAWTDYSTRIKGISERH